MLIAMAVNLPSGVTVNKYWPALNPLIGTDGVPIDGEGGIAGNAACSKGGIKQKGGATDPEKETGAVAKVTKLLSE